MSPFGDAMWRYVKREAKVRRATLRRRLQDPWLRLRLLSLVTLGVIAFGTAGYVLIESWSVLDALYMTLITLTTVGFGETRPLDSSGRWFTITLLVFGVTLLGVALSLMRQAVVQGELGARGRRRRMQARIEDLEEHFIVCGYGRVGRAVVDELEQNRVPFVVVDTDEELEEEFLAEGGAYILGDATQEETLRKAGVGRARGLVAALSSDADSAFATMTAKGVNPDLFIVSRASDPTSETNLYRAGADRVVSPFRASGLQMAQLALRPQLYRVLEISRHSHAFRLEEIHVDAGSDLVGKTVEELSEGRPVVAVLRGEDLHTVPGPDQALVEDDVVLLLELPPPRDRAER